MDGVKTEEFMEYLEEKGRDLYRDMPWRQDKRPYYVLVSELMLQQTQVERVIPKFQAFIAAFPDLYRLAEASLAEVLTLWQGLGYNRRAKFLHEAAKTIVYEFDGRFPENEADLLKLPGVGKNTAGAICVYAFNQPSLFIETNVRTVYIHHFFADDDAIPDTAIMQKLRETVPGAKGKEQPERRIHSAPGVMNEVPSKLDSRSEVGKTAGLSYGPKVFYWALMDYGSYLKSQGIRNTRQSKHYVRQSPLHGSVREVRGQIIRALTVTDYLEDTLKEHLRADERFAPALDGLVRDGLVTQTNDQLHLTK